MSSALVRQALELVDPEESGAKRKRGRGAARRSAAGQDHPHPYKPKKQKPAECGLNSEPSVEANVKKLLALSKPSTDTRIAEKIVQRAIKGRPLLEKVEVKKEKEKSILFPDEEPHAKFEREYFCS